jgi:hypothetical protein
MKQYLTTNGLLSAKVVKSNPDYVYLQFNFKGMDIQERQITKDSFTNLTKWVKDNFGYIYTIN